MQTQQPTNTNTMSYANRVKQTTIRNINYPKRDQAIIMTAYDNISIGDYVTKLLEYIKPTQIIGASRVGQGKICIYLDNKETANQIISNHPIINISGKEVKITSNSTPTTKIIISHVELSLPNPAIEQKLKEIGFKLASPITFLRIGINNEQLQHVLSFRRQVYIVKEEGQYIPDSLTIQHENEYYKIYLMADNFRCPICNRNGHTEKQCHQNKNKHITSTQHTTENITPLTPTEHTIEPPTEYATPSEYTQNNITPPSPTVASQEIGSTKITHKVQIHQTTETTDTDKAEERKKRNAPTSTSSDEMTVPEEWKEVQSKNPKKKKATTDIDTHLDKVKKMMEEEPNKNIITYEELKDILLNANGNKDKMSLAEEYTTETDELATFLDKIHPLITDTKTKNHVTRLRNNLITENTKQKNTHLTDHDYYIMEH